ncbi:MAG: hypothetical protein QOJ16_5084 [Acidobacteriota bacterium]|jgi:uncharacterized RDD family membrane protein YckC|nr:hypothetical protein [Acidobacteriota bacterium]
MRRRSPEGEDQEPSLFDLPLDLPDHDRLNSLPEDGENVDEVEASPPRPRPARLEALPAERPAPAMPAAPRRPAPVPVAPAPKAAPPAKEMEEDERTPGRAGLGSRLAAGLADLLVHAAIAAVALVGARLLGANPTPAEWPPMVIFLLAFSFLYTILPLAFWGQTLGMTWAGLLSRNRDGEPLTFDQTARRWFGGLLTAATLGLPLLLAGRGRTLTDLISSSNTFRAG